MGLITNAEEKASRPYNRFGSLLSHGREECEVSVGPTVGQAETPISCGPDDWVTKAPVLQTSNGLMQPNAGAK